MIQVIPHPGPETWPALLQRPVKPHTELNEAVTTIIADVKRRGDLALLRYAQTLDGVALQNITVSDSDIENASVDDALKAAIALAKKNIETFHKSDLVHRPAVETTKGVRCWRKSVPIEKVGLYIPGGSAPLFSTVLMLGIPAQLAGCKEIILCTPPGKDGTIHPAILFTARLIGIKKIYKVGGAQAIAAMAFGTASVPKVYKIFGPGNQYVTKAKALVQQEGTAIDMPAGPSELLVIADGSCQPEFVAADLLSQAEHGPDSQVILLSNSEKTVTAVNEALIAQLDALPRKAIAKQALSGSFALILDSLENCMAFSNAYAPEHLIIATWKNETLAAQVLNAGSVFVGNYSCESAGDYASGTNHTLPTNGYARNYSGVSTDSFMKKISFQEITEEGIKNIGPAVEKMALAEELYAHKNAVTLRLNALRHG